MLQSLKCTDNAGGRRSRGAKVEGASTNGRPSLGRAGCGGLPRGGLTCNLARGRRRRERPEMSGWWYRGRYEAGHEKVSLAFAPSWPRGAALVRRRVPSSRSRATKRVRAKSALATAQPPAHTQGELVRTGRRGRRAGSGRKTGGAAAGREGQGGPRRAAASDERFKLGPAAARQPLATVEAAGRGWRGRGRGLGYNNHRW
jgi:hypothetical protein